VKTNDLVQSVTFSPNRNIGVRKIFFSNKKQAERRQAGKVFLPRKKCWKNEYGKLDETFEFSNPAQISAATSCQRWISAKTRSKAGQSSAAYC
jgi:hypothetical protein